MWESEKEKGGKMTEIYTIFDQSYDNDNYTTNDNYTSFELFQQYQYKSECTFSFIFNFIHSFVLFCASKQCLWEQ